jgi:hypothetical protein
VCIRPGRVIQPAMHVDWLSQHHTDPIHHCCCLMTWLGLFPPGHKLYGPASQPQTHQRYHPAADACRLLARHHTQHAAEHAVLEHGAAVLHHPHRIPAGNKQDQNFKCERSADPPTLQNNDPAKPLPGLYCPRHAANSCVQHHTLLIAPQADCRPGCRPQGTVAAGSQTHGLLLLLLCQ